MADGKMFWESIDQAVERLPGTYVMYDGEVAYCDRVETRPEGPSCRITVRGENGKSEINWRLLSDPGFEDFRRLPPLGYCNVYVFGTPCAIHLMRRPERSRLHGIRDGRVICSELSGNGPVGARLSYNEITRDPGYFRDRVRSVFPTTQEIIENLVPNTSAAFSPQYAISLDDFDTFRLYRRDRLVGVVNGQGLVLSSTSKCYAEELSEIETVTVNVE